MASSKTKPGVDPEDYLAKALAWWLTLCGRMGIRSVEDMVWRKFPYACPYCELRGHNDDVCGPIKLAHTPPDWAKLRDIGRAHKDDRPHSLGEWLQMFTTIYPVQQTETYERVFARFSEELGELAEATRLFQIAPGYFFSEASDFFAWLMHLHAFYYRQEKLFSNSVFARIEANMHENYPDACPDCERQLCSCPPVLRKTVGRIAHDMPVAEDGENYAPVLSFAEAMEVFELSSSRIKLADQEIEVDEKLIKEIHQTVVDLRERFLESAGLRVQESNVLLATLDNVRQLAEAERATQESIDALSQAIARLPNEKRSFVLDLLISTTGSVWASALVAAVKQLVT